MVLGDERFLMSEVPLWAAAERARNTQILDLDSYDVPISIRAIRVQGLGFGIWGWGSGV